MKSLSYIIVFFPLLLNSQNLIPNGDFELGPNRSSNGWYNGFDNQCNLVDEVMGPDNWFLVENTPDRLLNGDIPCNWDNDIAYSGNAFVVFGYAEAGSAFLLFPLVKDSLYRLSYCISLETFTGLNNNGEAFHVEFDFNNGGNVIPSKYATVPHEWNCFDTVFIAEENSTTIKIRGLDFENTGVKLDLLSLTKESLSNLTDHNSQSLLIYPNPAKEKLFFKNLENLEKIELYNNAGKLLVIKNDLPQNILELENIENGVYTIKLYLSNRIIAKKIIISNP